MSLIEMINESIEEGVRVRSTLLDDGPKIIEAAELIAGALQMGGKVLAAGNGGSAADAMHFAAELEATFTFYRRGLPAMCLNSNISTMTAWSNDFDFSTLFERQVEAHGKPGDVLVAISTGGGTYDKGASHNIALGAKKAKEMGLKVIGLSGKKGGVLNEISDICFVVKSQVTARIQEAHITLLHVITQAVDEIMFPNKK